MGDISLPGWAVALAGMVVPGVFAWLFSHTVKGWEEKIASLKDDLTKQNLAQNEKLARLEGKLDSAAQKDQSHTEGFVEVRMRLEQLEREKDRLETHLEDLRGFFASQGFKRRDGDVGGG